jgi:hypothetical protein
MGGKSTTKHLCCSTMEPKKRKPDDPEQSKRFIDAAKEAGADESEVGADKAFKKVTAKRPSPKE